MLRAYARCERLYAVLHVKGWRPSITTVVGDEVPKARGLSFGAMTHEGLAQFYIVLKESGNLALALQAGLTALSEFPYAASQDPDEIRTKGRAMYDLKQYVFEYKGDKQWKLLMTETPSAIEDHEGFRYGGRMDLAVIDTEYGERLFPVDHKTTTRFTKFFFDNFKLDPQMMGYYWMAGKLTGIEPAGVIINAIVVHKKETVFARHKLLISPAHVARWRERNIVRYERISEQLAVDPQGDRWYEQEIWNPNFEHCVDRYGRCPMFPVCHGDPSNAAIHLNINFEPGRWDFTKIADDDEE
jgi:hypothetical protein